MAWSGSAIFRAFVTDYLSATISWDLNSPSDTINLALYDNDITPDKDASSANTAYNAGQWAASGNEVTDGAEWAAGGRALDSITITNPASGVVMLDCADEVSGTSATLSAYGGLVYNGTAASPVADQGICFNYFGGVVAVTDGTLTAAVHANGLFRITV